MKYKIFYLKYALCTSNNVCEICEKYNGVSPCIVLNDVFSPTTCKEIFPLNSFPVVQKVN